MRSGFSLLLVLTFAQFRCAAPSAAGDGGTEGGAPASDGGTADGSSTADAGPDAGTPDGNAAGNDSGLVCPGEDGGPSADAGVLWRGTAETGNLREWIPGGQLDDGSQPPAGSRIITTAGPQYGDILPTGDGGYTCNTDPTHTDVATTMSVVMPTNEPRPFCAHGGQYAVKAVHHGHCDLGGCGDGPTCACTTTTQNPSAGTRLFRWKESNDPQYFANGLYYGVWVYVPQLYTFTHEMSSTNPWLVVQFKSAIRPPDGGVTDITNDPIWGLQVFNRTPLVASPMYLVLSFGSSRVFGTQVGPYGTCGPAAQQAAFCKLPDGGTDCCHWTGFIPPLLTKDLPVGQWTHIVVYFKQWPQEVFPFGGRVAVWQDQDLLYDIGGPNDQSCGLGATSCRVMTKYGYDLDGGFAFSGSDAWSFNLYSNGMVVYPNGQGPGVKDGGPGYDAGPGTDPAVVYFDDATISLGFPN